MESMAFRSMVKIAFVVWLVGTLNPPVSAIDDSLSFSSNRHHETMLSLRWRGVVRQAYDYSCGTGSIANLIGLSGGLVPQERVLIDLYGKRIGAQALNGMMRNGFSLMDLKTMLELLGYQSEGMRYEQGTMPEKPKPMIVYLVVKGYRHFAVFAGTEGGLIVLLDSSRGRIRITHERLFEEWDGTALMLSEPRGISLPADEFGQTSAQRTARTAILLH